MNMLMTAARVLMDFTSDGAKEWLQNNPDLMEYESIVGDFFRTVGFAILKALHTLANSVEEGLTKAYDVLSFGLDDAVIGQLSQIESAVLTPLLTISVVVVGILFIVGSERVKASKVLQNLAVSLGVLVLMPWFISTLNDLTMKYVDAMAGSDEYTVDGMLDEAGNNPMNMVDLAYVFSNGAGDSDVASRIATTKIENDPWKINPTEKISKKKDNGGYSLKADWEIFKWQDDGNGYFQECDYDGVLKTGIGTNRPYRYHFNFWLGFFNLLTYIVVIIFTIVRCAQLAYSLVFKRLLATILAATDIASGDKLKFVLKNILYTYLTLMYCITALIIFKMAQTWIVGNSDFNAALKVLMLLGIAYAVIDGPNVFKQVFGIDAGVKDGYGALDRTLIAARTARGVAKDVGRAATAPGRIAGRIADANKTHGNEGRMSAGQVEGYNQAKTDNKKAHEDLGKAQAKYNAATNPEEKAKYQGQMDDAAARIQASQKTMDSISNGFRDESYGSRPNAPTKVADQSAMPNIKQDTDKPSERSAGSSEQDQSTSAAMPKVSPDNEVSAMPKTASDNGRPTVDSTKPPVEQTAADTQVQPVKQSDIPSVQSSDVPNPGQVQGTEAANVSVASQQASIPAAETQTSAISQQESSVSQQASVPVTETQTSVSSTPAAVQTSAQAQTVTQIPVSTQVQTGTLTPVTTTVQTSTQGQTGTIRQAGTRIETPAQQTVIKNEQTVQNIQKIQNAPTQPNQTNSSPANPSGPLKSGQNPKKGKNR